MKLYHQFKNVLQKHRLVKKGDTVIVGVSGGSDSVALLHLLYEVSEIFKLTLVVAHVNYHTRGKDSDADAALVKRHAKELGLKFEIKDAKDPKKGNFEMWARDVRYAFFEKLRKKHKAEWIAVGHTKDDQAETILMHFIKGAGLEGLAGMALREGYVIRPALFFTKQELRDYLEAKNETYHDDKTNEDWKFVRNALRHQIIEDLQKLNPNILETFARNAQIFREAQDLFTLEAAVFLNKHARHSKKYLDLPKQAFLTQPRPIQREVVHGALKKLGHNEPLSAAHYDQVESIITKNIPKKVKEISRHLKIEIHRDVIRITKTR